MFVSSHFKNLNHWYTVDEFDSSTTMFTYHVISGPRFLEKDNPVIGGLRGLYYQIIIYYLFLRNLGLLFNKQRTGDRDQSIVFFVFINVDCRRLRLYSYDIVIMLPKQNLQKNNTLKPQKKFLLRRLVDNRI